MKNIEDLFIRFNVNILKKFRKNCTDSIAIFMNLHPLDLYSEENKNNKYSEFVSNFVNKLQEESFEVYVVSDYLDSQYKSEIIYEMVELFLNPNYFVCSYLSASLITSHLSKINKFLIELNDNFLFKMVPS